MLAITSSSWIKKKKIGLVYTSIDREKDVDVGIDEYFYVALSFENISANFTAIKNIKN